MPIPDLIHLIGELQGFSNSAVVSRNERWNERLSLVVAGELAFVQEPQFDPLSMDRHCFTKRPEETS